MTIKNYITGGWPKTPKNIPDSVAAYFKFKSEITEGDGLLFKNNKVIVPKALRHELVEKVHGGHLGVRTFFKSANQSFWWPSVNKHIEDVVLSCPFSQLSQKAHAPDPMMIHKIINKPWHKVGADLFHFDNDVYLLCVCYNTKFVEICNFNNDLTSENVIRNLKACFARYGVPLELVTDNGPEFKPHLFEKFVCDWDFKHKIIADICSKQWAGRKRVQARQTNAK